MSYTGRKKFKTAREKNKDAFKNMKAVIFIVTIAAIVYVMKNRVSIIDHIQTYFY